MLHSAIYDEDEDMSDEPVGENEDVEDGDFMQDSDSDGE